MTCLAALSPSSNVQAQSAPGGERAGNADADAVIGRRQIVLALAVALAGFGNASGLVDAEIADHVARPAAPVARAREPLFGGEHAVAAARGGVAAEIGLVAEQAEAVLHFPFDAQIAGRRRQDVGRRGGRKLGAIAPTPARRKAAPAGPPREPRKDTFA